MSTVPDYEIRSILVRYGISVTYELCEQLRIYLSLLLRWNEKIPLTSVTDPREIIRFHFGESMFAVKQFNIVKGRLADVGSGAGFPGVPLRMLSPNLQITLIEANSKKATFLAELVRELELNAEIFRGRAEDFTPKAKGFNFITSRAVGNWDQFMFWCGEHLAVSGSAILWISEADANALVKNARNWNWSQPVRIPDSKQRMIVAGSLDNGIRGTADVSRETIF